MIIIDVQVVSTAAEVAQLCDVVVTGTYHIRIHVVWSDPGPFLKKLGLDLIL